MKIPLTLLGCLPLIASFAQSNLFTVMIEDSYLHRETISPSFVQLDCQHVPEPISIPIRTKHFPITIHCSDSPGLDSCYEVSLESKGIYHLGASSSVIINSRSDLIDGGNFIIENSDTVPVMTLSFSRRASIDLDYSSPLNKPGWNLILSDDFEVGLDAEKWHRSNFVDGGNARCDKGGTTRNPEAVSVSNGECRIVVANQAHYGCEFSSGEIKSFSTLGDIEPYVFYNDGYLEVRAKLAISDGLGSVAWLYCFRDLYPGSYSEIDLFEVDGVNRHQFQTNYWYGEKPDQYPETISVTRQDCTFDCKVDLTEHFVIYAVEWTTDYIRFYVNGSQVREIRLDDPTCGPSLLGCNDCKTCGWMGKECCVYGHAPNRPYVIRFGTSNNTIGASGTINPSALPEQMSIDHIRVYKKADQPAALLSDVPTSVCSNEYFFPKAQYYPGVTYVWSCPAVVSFEPWPTDASVRATIAPDLSGSAIYPLTVTAHFPDGHTEVRSANVQLSAELPSPPSQTISITPMADECHYMATMDHFDQNDILEWKEQYSSEWKEGGVIDGLSPQKLYVFDFRTRNGCGYSETVTMNFETPASARTCLWDGFIDPDALSEAWTFKVCDVTGQVLCEGRNIDDMRRINSLPLPSGVYILFVQSAEGSVLAVQKLVRN